MFWFSNKKTENNSKIYNVIITGYGGQGVITLAELISKIALKSGYDVRQAEIHGLAQRGGSLQAHVRFGPKGAPLGGDNLYSPKVKRGDADLIIALDFLEAGRGLYWASPNKTTILCEKEIYWPSEEKIESRSVLEIIKKFAKKLEIVEAEKISEEILGNNIASNIFMLGFAINKKYLPFEKEKAWETIEEKFPKEYIESNKKIFEKAFEK